MILEILLNIKIKKINIIEYQKAIELKHGKKGIRMDVYLEDDETVYNVEMQVESKHNLILRARFYRGALDLNLLETGKDYNKLKKSYVIFLCMFDPFEKNQSKYIFQNMCKLDNSELLPLNDDSYTVFFNANAYLNENKQSLRDFLAYVKDKKVNSDFIKEIDEEVAKIKSNNQWEVEYMTFYANYIDDIAIAQEEVIQEYSKIIKEKDDKLLEKDNKLLEKDNSLKEKDDKLLEKDDKLLEKDNKLLEKDNKLLEKDNKILEKEESELQMLIKQLSLFNDDTIAQLYNISIEEAAQLRKEPKIT